MEAVTIIKKRSEASMQMVISMAKGIGLLIVILAFLSSFLQPQRMNAVVFRISFCIYKVCVWGWGAVVEGIGSVL